MSLIQLRGGAAEKFKGFLAAYRTTTGKEPSYEQRTEAYFCAISADPWDRPSWCM